MNNKRIQSHQTDTVIITSDKQNVITINTDTRHNCAAETLVLSSEFSAFEIKPFKFFKLKLIKMK